MPTTEGTAQPTIDWRDWIAFLGYVLAAAVVVSVMLASVVLVISMQAEGPTAGSAAPAETRLAAPESREAAPPTPPAAAKVSTPPTAPAPAARIEVTAESLRADKPIAAPQPAPASSDPAARPARAASESAAAPARSSEAAATPPRIEITSESLRAEKPIGQAEAAPQAPASAEGATAQSLAPSAPAADAQQPAASVPAATEQATAPAAAASARAQ